MSAMKMFVINIFVLIILNKIMMINSFWPPPYKVDLKQSEEFIIGEYVEGDLDADDEMIHNSEIENLNEEKHKYDLLHKNVKRYNDKINKNLFYFKNNKELFQQNEIYYESEEFKPEVAGFVDDHNNFLLNQDNINVYYLNKITKRLVAEEIKQKREENSSNDYNYDEFNKEYQILLKKDQSSYDTFNSTNVEEGESVNEALNKLVDFKDTPRNCTKEELRGIGFAAVKCVWIDYRKSNTKESKSFLFKRILRIISIWFSVYALIAIPCWCQKGWCCCCFQCKFCKPRNRIQEATKYFMNNPPGKYVNSRGEEIFYEPTDYEIDTYFKLERVLMSL